MERSLITDTPRDKYVERCKQRASDYLDRGDLKNAVASFVSDIDARTDCELPHYLATLGVLLLMGNDALGRRTLIEGLSGKASVQVEQSPPFGGSVMMARIAMMRAAA
jgi:hypothetical protein